MAKYKTPNEAMVAGDELAEAEMRYGLLAEVFEAVANLRSNLNSQLERAKVEIIRLRALVKPSGGSSTTPDVIAFDPTRFRKSDGCHPGPDVATIRA